MVKLRLALEETAHLTDRSPDALAKLDLSVGRRDVKNATASCSTHADSLTGPSQRRTTGHQHPEPRLLINQVLLQRHPQHLTSERCCDDRLNSPSPTESHQLSAGKSPGSGADGRRRSPLARQIAAPATVYAVIATVGAIRSTRQGADRRGQWLDLGRDREGNAA